MEFIMSSQTLEKFENNNNGSSQSEGVEFIKDSNIIKEGMFAVLKKQNRQLPYDIGVVLLIDLLKFADNNLHSVSVRHHPNYSEHSVGFLLDEFYEFFDVISQKDGEEIRQKEIESLKTLISHKEEVVQEYRNNPQKLQAEALSIYSKRIESPTSNKIVRTDNIINLLGQANALEQINSIKSQANMFGDVAKIQSEILKKGVNELQLLMGKLIPFLNERYAVSIASTKETEATMKDANDGIESLNLYTGDGVDVYEIKRGVEATQNIPLSLVQNRIICDVELAYFNDKRAAHLDADSIVEDFFDVIAENPKLVNQIFPTERCVCIAVIRESDIDYKDTYWNIVMNKINKKAFLLIRNGENISAIYSPIGSHLAAKNLFPSKDILDKCFLSGTDGINITVDNLKYSDALNEIDQITLHYKRFLLLLAGLQHRLNLLGLFYPENESFDIFFPHFQNKYFNFIHDQDGTGMLADLKEPSLESYIALQNSTLAKGSNIICRTNAMVSEDAAPYCWTYSWRRGTYGDSNALTRYPINDIEIVKVEQDKDGFFVRFPVNSGYSQRDALAKVRIDEGSRSLNYLVLDGLNADRLEGYISKRKYRQFYLDYIDLFKEAQSYIQSFEMDNKKAIQYYLNAVEQIQDINKPPLEVKEIVMRCINFFSAKVSQSDILGFLHQKISDSALTAQSESISKLVFIKEDRYLIDSKAIATTVDRSGNRFMYITLPKDLELSALSKLEKDYWVYRCPVKSIKNGRFNIDKAEIVSILDYVRDEIVLNVVDKDLYGYYYKIGATPRQNLISEGKGSFSYNKLFKSYEEKQKFLNVMLFSKEFIEALFSNKLTGDLIDQMQSIVKSQVEKLSSSLFDNWGNERKREVALTLPYCVFERSNVGAICLRGGIAWLDSLAARLHEHGQIIDQNNLAQEIGVLKIQFNAEAPNSLFLETLDIGSGFNTFRRNNALESQYVHSVKLLSYVLHSSAKKLIHDNHFSRLDSVDVQANLKYCSFDENVLIEFSPALDNEIQNPNLIGTTQIIKAHRIEEVIRKGKDIVSRFSHIYIGAEPYLSEYIEHVKDAMNSRFLEFEGNLNGEIYYSEMLNQYVCSTGDFEKFRSDMIKNIYSNPEEAEIEQVQDHIFKVVKEI